MRNKKIIIVWFITGLLLSCNTDSKELTADKIIDQALEASGSDIIDNARISFKFRKYYFDALRKKGEFQLKRCTDPQCQDTVDILKNTGFERQIAHKTVALPDSMVQKYTGSVNSVHYFAILPYGLDNKMVNKERAGESTIKGKSYYRVHVSFEATDDGAHQDQYMYWINKETFMVDYLAYNFDVNDGGTRFREAYNVRTIAGARIVDYRNYKPKEKFPKLTDLDSLFINGQLDLLSIIELEDVKVTPCPNC